MDYTKIKLKWLDSNGCEHEAIPQSATIDMSSGGASLFSRQPSMTLNYSLPATMASDCSSFWNMDEDAMLKTAMTKHDASQSDVDGDGSSIYFGSNGILVISMALPCSNNVKIMVNGDGDPTRTCDNAISMLEKMKSCIDEMERKVFELSLSQNAADEGE